MARPTWWRSCRAAWRARRRHSVEVEALPGGWEEFYDEVEKKTFFFNRLSRVSQYERPSIAPAKAPAGDSGGGKLGG